MKYSKSYTYQAMANELRNRLNGRPYSIGLDLGVGSIGIAAVAMEPDSRGILFPTDLVYANSRMFKPSEGAADRRKARGQRNSLRHKSNRLKKTWKILSEKGLMLPYSEEVVDNSATLRFSEETLRKSPYEIRYKGLHEELSLEELGYALYHIANHRGSSSVRTFIDAEKTDDEKKLEEQRRLTENLVSETGARTFIEVLWAFNKDEFKGYRNSQTNGSPRKAPIPTRDIIRNEVDSLLLKQKEYHRELSDEYNERIKESIFYENEKFVPEPGHCPYFKDEFKLPAASFLNEERRLWESLINIRINREIRTQRGITRSVKLGLCDNEMNTLFDYLREGKELTPSILKKVLPQYKADEIILPGNKNNPRIKGFRFCTLENKPFWKRLDQNQKDRFISLYVNTPDDKSLSKQYKDELGLSEQEVKDVLETVSLVGGYAPVGKTAMEIILNRIKKDRLTYGEAETMCIIEGELEDSNARIMYDRLPYYGKAIPTCTQNLAGKAWHTLFSDKLNKPGFIKPNTNPEEEKFGKIANPVVHQTLNELRKLLNEVIDIFGYKPVEITVETARELKVGMEEREEISKNNAIKEKRNENLYKEYCVPNNLPRTYVKKFRIWEDQGTRCPYCLKEINVFEIVNGSCDYEHILPKEDTGDSSELNLVIAHKICNSDKNKRIPFDAFGNNHLLWEKIEQNLDSCDGMKERKNRFLMTKEDYDSYLEKKGFMSRFSSDNAYVARISCEYLRSLYPPEEKYSERYVRTIKGGETALLRSAWNLNGITASLGLLHVPELADSLEEDKKSREDIRHHALDAIVAAYYTYSARQMIETESAKNTDQSMIKRRIPIPRNFRSNPYLSTKEERIFFRQYIEDFIVNKTYGSWKMDTAKNGQLTKDTQYSIFAQNDTSCVLFTKKKISSIDAKTLLGKKSGSVEHALTCCKPPEWLSPKDKARFEAICNANRKKLDVISATLDKAESQLIEENKKKEKSGKAKIAIKESTIVKRALSLVGGWYYILSNNTLSKLALKVNGEKAISAFDTGDNYCIDFFRCENGEIEFEILRKINVVSNSFVPKYKQRGCQLIERLYGKEILEVDSALLPPAPDKGELVRSIKCPNAPNNRTFVMISTFTETSSGFQIRYDSMMHSKSTHAGSISRSTLPKLQIRKVVISPAGLVIYRSPILGE